MQHPHAIACSFVLGVIAACGNGDLVGADMSDGETGDESGGDGDGDGDVPLEAVSILMVVDNSGSMGIHQRKLASGAQALLGPLDAAGIPWRLGITTTDNGNPWCDDLTTPEAGNLVLSSCLNRPDDFMFNSGEAIPADFPCQDMCSLLDEDFAIVPTTTAYDPNPVARPWIESIDGETNIEGATLEEVLPCMLLQGFTGCGFEQQLQSAYLSVGRSASTGDDEYGFIDDSRLLVIVFVTDEMDCSYNPDSAEIFLEDGDKTFWSDPQAQFPTSAVCWNAGMQCTGDPSNYDDCVATNFDIDGKATNDPAAAVLRSVDGMVDNIEGLARAQAFGIVGVAADGSIHYADVGDTDPEYQNNFGIGPGCTAPPPPGWSDPVQAVPPARIWTALESMNRTGGNPAFSICEDDFSSALAAMGAAIVAEF
jgi:hypothetical protein